MSSDNLKEKFLGLSQTAIAAGIDGRRLLAQDPTYTDFRNVLTSLASPTTSVPPDWTQIDKSCQRFASQAADLLVYAFLCQSSFQTKAYAGLTAALSALDLIVAQGWDVAGPPRQRQEIFRLLSKKLAGFIPKRPPSSDQKPDAELCLDALRGLNERLMNVGMPSMTEALQALEAVAPPALPPSPSAFTLPAASEAARTTTDPTLTSPPQSPTPTTSSSSVQKPDTLSIPAAEPSPTPATASAAPASAPSATPLAQSITNNNGLAIENASSSAPEARAELPVTRPDAAPDEDADRKRRNLEREVFAAVGKLADLIRQENRKDVSSYRMLRLVVWAGIKAPAADKQGKTRLPPPPPHLVKKIQGPLTAPQAASSLDEVETQLRVSPLWLDLQCRAVRCLELLQAFDAVEIIRLETQQLLKQLPQAIDLKFSGGLPFASEETLRWLQTMGTRSSIPAAPMSSNTVYDLAGAEVGEVGHSMHGSTDPIAGTVSPENIAGLLPLSGLLSATTSLPATDPSDERPPEGLLPGLVYLGQLVARSHSGQRRYELRQRMVAHCLLNGRADLARPLVELLETDAERHHLQEWAPELLAETLKYQILVMRANSASQTKDERIKRWHLLCQINPAIAAAIAPERSL